LRNPHVAQRCAPHEAEESDMPETSPMRGVSEIPDPQGSEISEGRGQKTLTQKTTRTKKRKQGAPLAPISLALSKPEMQNPFWCPAHGYCHGERQPDHRLDCVREPAHGSRGVWPEGPP
jgi:hypothetical protein